MKKILKNSFRKAYAHFILEQAMIRNVKVQISLGKSISKGLEEERSKFLLDANHRVATREYTSLSKHQGRTEGYF